MAKRTTKESPTRAKLTEKMAGDNPFIAELRRHLGHPVIWISDKEGTFEFEQAVTNEDDWHRMVLEDTYDLDINVSEVEDGVYGVTIHTVENGVTRGDEHITIPVDHVLAAPVKGQAPRETVGSKIINTSEGLNSVLYKFTEIMKDDENEDTLRMGLFILMNDRAILTGCNSGEDLEKKVLTRAEKNGSYASMDYDTNDFLDSDHEEATCPDDGLAWVAFEDLWAALTKLAETL